MAVIIKPRIFLNTVIQSLSYKLKHRKQKEEASKGISEGNTLHLIHSSPTPVLTPQNGREQKNFIQDDKRRLPALHGMAKRRRKKPRAFRRRKDSPVQVET